MISRLRLVINFIKFCFLRLCQTPAISKIKTVLNLTKLLSLFYRDFACLQRKKRLLVKEPQSLRILKVVVLEKVKEVKMSVTKSKAKIKYAIKIFNFNFCSFIHLFINMYTKFPLIFRHLFPLLKLRLLGAEAKLVNNLFSF